MVARIKKNDIVMVVSGKYVCPSSNKPCRVGSKVTDNGKRARMSRRSQEIF